METLRIAALTARYRLPASARDARPRLDALLRQLLGDALEPALERAGIPLGEEICIRHVEAPVRLRLSAPDASLLKTWSTTLAEAIRRALADDRAVVRYPSRVHAVVDLVSAVARREYGRAWAWRQLGLWRVDDGADDATAIDAVVRALCDEPNALVPVLRTVADRGALAMLAPRLSASAWVTLARAALAAAGLPPALVGSDLAPLALPSAVRRQADRIVSASALAPAVMAAVAPSAAIEAIPVVRRAAAILALLETEPAALCTSDERRRTLVAALTAAFGSTTRTPAEPVEAAAPRRAAARRETEAPRQATPGDTEAPHASALEAADDRRREARAPATARPHAGDTRTSPPPVRQHAHTGAGGLLFLLHLVDELGVPEELVSTEALAARPFRWMMHRLALILAGVEASDPAVLAFAGLGPESEPPSRGQEPPTDDELGALLRVRERITGALAARLERGETPQAQLAWVCQREADVVADPGWIELHFPLDQVSTEIRRIGLDLDPLYLPWLGAVVRFVYE